MVSEDVCSGLTRSSSSRAAVAAASIRYDENGFIANGVNIEGGVICLSKLALTWIPKTFDEITPDR